MSEPPMDLLREPAGRFCDEASTIPRTLLELAPRGGGQSRRGCDPHRSSGLVSHVLVNDPMISLERRVENDHRLG